MVSPPVVRATAKARGSQDGARSTPPPAKNTPPTGVDPETYANATLKYAFGEQ
jgi:hypothetical protein